MSKLTDEQIEMMLKNDSLKSSAHLRVSRGYIYTNVSHRSKKITWAKLILTALLAAITIGSPIIDAASYYQPGPPKILYEAPGITMKIKQITRNEFTQAVEAAQSHASSTPLKTK